MTVEAGEQLRQNVGEPGHWLVIQGLRGSEGGFYCGDVIGERVGHSRYLLAYFDHSGLRFLNHAGENRIFHFTRSPIW